MSESMRKIVYYENILEFKQNTNSGLNLNEVNNWQLCRTCLVEAKEGDWDLKKMCVLDAFDGTFLSAQQMLAKVTNMQFNEGDDLPLKMCKDCMEKLMILYFFSIQVHKAEKVLNNLSQKLRRGGGGGEETTTPSTTVSEVQKNTDSKVELEDSDDDTYSVVLPTEQLVDRCKSPSLSEDIKLRLNQVEATPDIAEDAECGTEDAKKCDTPTLAKSFELSKEIDENLPSIVGGQKCDVVEKKESEGDEAVFPIEETKKCESPVATDNPADSSETILMEVEEEDYEEIENEDLQSAYDFEVCKETNEVAFENEDVATTVEIYLNDELEEHLEEKNNWEVEIENNEDDVEVVVANTIFLDETSNTNCAEPVHITRSKLVEKSSKTTQFKHKQKRVTKPLLESRKCDVCQKSFKLQRDLVSHVKEQHPNCKAYQCRECGQLFSYTQSLSRHMNTHKDELQKNNCSYCPKAFLRPDDLIRHIRTHTGERPYKCPKCSKAFKQQGEMKQHLTTHLERRAYECDQCYCVLTSRNSLYLHKKSNHGKSEDQQIKCSHCKKSFKSKRDLLEHEKCLHAIEEDGDHTVWNVVVEE